MFPALFTSFSCCGGGLLALMIGPTTFPSLSLYSRVTRHLCPRLLAVETYLMSRGASGTERCWQVIVPIYIRPFA
jgi:hypothetical protein